MKKLTTLLTLLLTSVICLAQTGTLQVYCPEGINIYLDDKLVGKSNTEMSGLLIEVVAAGSHAVKAYKSGYITQTTEVTIKANEITSVTFEMTKDESDAKKYIGLSTHFGAFGLFNVNNVFTKASYSFGFTPYIDFKVHPNFLIGAEWMTMWGKPMTSDDPRMMMSPNLRLSLLFEPFEKVDFNFLVASGFAIWPGNTATPALTPTLNDTRYGWDFRAIAGSNIDLSTKAQLNLSFGYWASSSSSDDIVWITHDSMIITLGPKWRF